MALEFVGIQLDLRGADEVYDDLERIDTLLKSFNGRKKVKSGLTDLKKDAVAARGEIEKLEKELEELREISRLYGKDKPDWVDEDIEEYSKQLKNARDRLKDIKQAEREVQASTRNMGRTVREEFNAWSSRIAHVGSAMQSFGNALTRVGSFMRPITTGLLMGAGYKALNLFTEGFGNAFERADTMKNYDRQLKALGLDVAQTFSIAGKEAKTAKENLDDAVQGLPTSLDEIMAAQKVYAGATGEMVNSTKTAIAANNTFLASGMGAREQRFMQKYLVALSSGAELTTTQWQSMERIAPLAMRAVSKELGYAGNAYSEFRDDVEHGKIAGEDFLKAFQKVGISGAVANAARAQTESWNGLFSNIRIAVTRMGANVLETLNQTFKDATGRTLLQRLLGWDSEGKELGDGIKHWINDMSDSVQEWIKSNPDRILEFFDTLKNIDFKGLFEGMAQGMGDLLGIIEKFAEIASDKDMSKLGRFLAKSGFYGRAFTIIGGVIKGMRHPLAAIGTIGTWMFKGKAGSFFGKMSELFGKKKDIDEAGDAAKSIPTVSETFKSAFSALEGLIKAAGAITLVAGTGFVAFKAAKSILTDLKDMVDLVNGGGWDNVGYVASGVIVAIGTFTEIFNAVGTALGPQGLLGVAIASAASALVTGAFAGDMWLIKQGVIQIRDTILELDNVASAITNMKGIGTLDNNIKEKFRTTIDAINEIKNMFVGKSGSIKDQGQVEAGIPIFTNFRVTALTNIADAIEQMQRIVKRFNRLSELTLNDPSQILEDLKTACDKLQGIRGPKNIEKHTEKVAEALIQVRRMAYHINKLAGTDVNVAGFGNFVQQIKDALADFKELSGELMLDIEVKLSPLFGSSVEGVKKNIREAKRDIERLKKPPIAFSIPVTVTFSVTSNLASALARILRDRQRLIDASSGSTTKYDSPIGPPRGPAKGGLIYRAKGGGVGFPGRPIGTDRIPAWLSAGEFVHNKRAVNMFGIDFMRKVNNLDMKGAMNELMHRAGHMANVNRGASITNNYNNNQKVVINNNNAGAGFTFKSASRFVGAF